MQRSNITTIATMGISSDAYLTVNVNILMQVLTVNVNNDGRRNSDNRFCNHEEKILLHRDKQQKRSCYMSKEESFGVLT